MTTRRKCLFAIVAMIGVLVFIEGLCSIAAQFVDLSQTSTVNLLRDSPAGRHQLVYDRGNLEGNIKVQLNFPLNVPDARLMFRTVPNVGGGLINLYSGINKQGFRGRVIEPRRFGDQARRILLVGDSCIFGSGIRDYKNTIGARLEDAQTARGVFVKTFNIAQCGYSSYQQVLLFREWFDVVNPDTVIFYLGWNDIWQDSFLSDRQTIQYLRFANSPVIKFITLSRTYAVTDAVIKKLKPKPTELQYEFGDGSRVPMNEAVENYSEMVTRSLNNNAQVIIILNPTCAADLLPQISPYNEKIRQAMAALSEDVRFITQADFDSLNDHGASLFQEDRIHLNEAGAKFVVELLMRRLYPPAAMATIRR